MTPAARLSAAIEVLAELAARPRPAADVLKDWGQSHRFAGSADRAAIAGLVYDGLRRRASAAWIMDDESPRAIVLGTLRLARGLDVDAIARLADGSRFAPTPLTEQERARLAAASLDGAPPPVRGDYPEWLDPYLAETFGEMRAEEGAALAARAPLDLRVNSLKTTLEKAAAALEHFDPAPTPWSPVGLRIALAADGKQPPVTSEPAFRKGWFEIQDEGSQLSALLSGAVPGEQVLDLCAGSGGKTLALAAQMENRGQIFAYDEDPRRLAPIHDRLKRASARNVQVRTPRRAPPIPSPASGGGLGRGQARESRGQARESRGQARESRGQARESRGQRRASSDVLADLAGRMDLVLIDAPCTGTGVWRRHPDAKWRVRPGALRERVQEQAALLDQSVQYLKPGGRIAYVTCSVLDAENGAQVRAFCSRTPGFAALPAAELLRPLGERAAILNAAAWTSAEGVLLTPRRSDTDGFFVSLLASRPAG